MPNQPPGGLRRAAAHTPAPNRQIAKWNARYAARAPGALEEPSPSLPQAVSGVPPGRALDLACGAGRHAVWLAERGWQVDAVDGSQGAVRLLLANAARAGCRERVAGYVADLEADPPGFAIPTAAYDLIVDCYFLHRPLFAAIREGVRPGGLFVAGLHLPAPGAGSGHRFVLREGELAERVRAWNWEIRHTAERPAGPDAEHGLGVAEIVARRPPLG